MATVQNMVDALKLELKDPDLTNYSTAEFMVYINQAVRAITRRISMSWPEFWLLTGQTTESDIDLVTDTARYALPDGFYHLIAVADSDGAMLDCLTLAKALDGDYTGYILRGGKLELHPTPDADEAAGITLFCVSTPDEVTSIDDTVPLSDWFEDLIVYYVALVCKVRQEEDASGMSAFYRMMRSEMDGLAVRLNKPTGLTLGQRNRNWA